jgi:hypothetical protein
MKSRSGMRPRNLPLAVTLALVSLPLLVREARREGDPRLFWRLLGAESLRLVGAAVRHDVTYGRYAGDDVEGYHRAGASLARGLRRGDLEPVRRIVTGGNLTGTDFVHLTTGAVYAVVGTRRLAAFQVYSWLSFWGVFSFRRAFVRAVPEGSVPAYEALLFLTPSLVFWPAAIGKDAWLLFSLGLTADGASMLASAPRRGVARTVLGLSLASAVRPHVGAAVATALTGAQALRRPRRRPVELAAFAAAASVWSERYVRRFEIDSRAGWRAALRRMVERTAKGGSRFSPSTADTLARAPRAAATVLFRPHLLEAHNAAAFAAAAENAFLLALSLRRLAWGSAAIRSSAREPYVAFALASTAGLVALFSGLANFGLLVRQRTQLLPFYFVLLSIPPARPR